MKTNTAKKVFIETRDEKNKKNKNQFEIAYSLNEFVYK